MVTLRRDGLGSELIDLEAGAAAAEWRNALADVDAVIHLGALAHRVPEAAALTAINVDWPLRLFEGAAAAGVADFVFLSSVKVFGERSHRPLTVDDPYAPADAYGESKVRAEQGLRALQSAHPGIRLSILRAPLVYGPGVKANFQTLLDWARRGRQGWLLPFGGARAPRSLVSVQNLTQAIVASLGHAGVFHCADPEDLSVAELFLRLGVPRWRLLPVPAAFMQLLLTLIGRGSDYTRLYEPLQLDSSDTAAALGWKPLLGSGDALALLHGKAG